MAELIPLEDDRNDTINFIRNPSNWPYNPFLPVKRYINGGVETGIVIGLDFGHRFLWPNVYSGSLYQLLDQRDKGEELTLDHKIGYDSIEEMVLAGWRVD